MSREKEAELSLEDMYKFQRTIDGKKQVSNDGESWVDLDSMIEFLDPLHILDRVN